MAFGKPNRSVRHLLTPGQPVELAIQLNGGSAKVIGLPKDNTTDVAAADPAEQAMEGVIAELSAALYLVDIDFTLHAEIIEEMITGESERPAEEIDEDVTEIASLAHEKVGHILFPLLHPGSSDRRRVGTECVSQFSSRCASYH